MWLVQLLWFGTTPKVGCCTTLYLWCLLRFVFLTPRSGTSLFHTYADVVCASRHTDNPMHRWWHSWVTVLTPHGFGVLLLPHYNNSTYVMGGFRLKAGIVIFLFLYPLIITAFIMKRDEAQNNLDKAIIFDPHFFSIPIHITFKCATSCMCSDQKVLVIGSHVMISCSVHCCCILLPGENTMVIVW